MLPLPDGSTVAEDAAFFTQDRGSVFIEPVSKSTLQVPSAYAEKDICDNVAYAVAGSALALNDVIECRLVSAGSFSIKVRVPFSKKGDAGYINSLLDNANAALLDGLFG